MISNANGPDKPESMKCFPNLTAQRLGNLKLQTFFFHALQSLCLMEWPCASKNWPRDGSSADDIYCPKHQKQWWHGCMWISCEVKSLWCHASIWSGLSGLGLMILMGDPSRHARVNETTPYIQTLETGNPFKWEKKVAIIFDVCLLLKGGN